MQDPIKQKLDEQLFLLTQWARLTNKGGYIAESIDAEINRITKLIEERNNGN